MSNLTILIDELKLEHDVLLKCLNDVEKSGLDSEIGHNGVLALRRKILSHLLKEDEELYPILREKYIGKTEVQELTNRISFEMKKLAVAFLEFVHKYSGEHEAVNIKGEFESITKNLKERINEEEKFFTRYV